MPNEERERFYLEQLRMVRDLPSCPVSRPPEKRPDFLIVSGGYRVGIEVTEFYPPPPCGQRLYQEQQSLKDQIVERAERLHAQEGGPALYVSVNFHPSFVLDKADLQAHAQTLANSVLQSPVRPSIEASAVEIPWGHRPGFTTGILLQRSVNGQDKQWCADAGGMESPEAPITSAHVSTCVKAKTKKYNEGTAPHPHSLCDELWLVIVHNRLLRKVLPIEAELTNEVREMTYAGPFDRLIWLVPGAPPRAFDLHCRFTWEQ
jgi:hypothetical protein